VQPTLCFDLNEEAAAKWASSFGNNCGYTTDFEAAKAADADFAVVSTPNLFHLQHAGDLLRSGKHVLVQKPLARSLEEAKSLHQIALACPDRKLGVYMNMLDFELWWEVRAALQQGNIFGNPVEISVRLGHTGGLVWREQDASSWRLKKERTGGGAFVMLGVHYVHLMRWLTGLEIRRLVAQAPNLQCPHIEGEDICLVQGELSNGVLFSLGMAWNSQGEHFALYGTKGSFLYLDNEMVRVHSSSEWNTKSFSYNSPGRWQTFGEIIPPALDEATNPFNQHIQFSESVRDSRPLTVDHTDGLYDMRVVDAVYRSAASGGWEVLDES
jgi:predicted dehydrogenase